MTPLELAFPGLAAGYRSTSPADDDTNCVAWAAGEAGQWWWPDPFDAGHWPPGVPRAETLEAFAVAHATLGYTPAGSAELVAGVQKVAVYAKGGRPTHAARQLPTGEWTSKLGSGPDIAHALDGVAGDLYGTVALILERPRPA